MSLNDKILHACRLYVSADSVKELDALNPFALLNGLLCWRRVDMYAAKSKAFKAFLDSFPTMDVGALEERDRRILTWYATYYERCDLIDLWLPHIQGDGSWLNIRFTYKPALLAVLPQLLASGKPTEAAATKLLKHAEVWPYLVQAGFLAREADWPYTWFDVTGMCDSPELWQFFCEAIGPAVVADPRILYRALTNGFGPNSVPAIWRFTVDKEGAMDYRGEIGTIRELFALRHIYDLEGLPPAPSDCPLLAPIFNGETNPEICALAIESAARVSDEFAEYVAYCSRGKAPKHFFRDGLNLEHLNVQRVLLALRMFPGSGFIQGSRLATRLSALLNK